MKIGFYSNVNPYATEGNSMLDALRKKPQVEKIVKLTASNLIIETGTSSNFSFDGISLDKSFDLIIFRGAQKEVKNALEVIKYCQENNIKFFDNNLSVTKYAINKKADILSFTSNNIPIPYSIFLNRIEDLSHLSGFPLVMKSITSSQGKGVFLVSNLNDIEKVFKETGKQINNFVFQEFIDYKYDLRCIIVGGKFIGSMRRIPTKDDFRANFSLGGSVERFEVDDDIKDLALKVASAAQLDIAGVDILIDKNDQPIVLEANRNPGLKGISQALNIDVGEIVVNFILEKCGF